MWHLCECTHLSFAVCSNKVIEWSISSCGVSSQPIWIWRFNETNELLKFHICISVPFWVSRSVWILFHNCIIYNLFARYKYPSQIKFITVCQLIEPQLTSTVACGCGTYFYRATNMIQDKQQPKAKLFMLLLNIYTEPPVSV